MELKPWYVVIPKFMDAAFNRTSLELKLFPAIFNYNIIGPFNRTSLELKQRDATPESVAATIKLLIEPVWN